MSLLPIAFLFFDKPTEVDERELLLEPGDPEIKSTAPSNEPLQAASASLAWKIEILGNIS